MAKGALTELARFDDDILRTKLAVEQQSWLCPHCEIGVNLTKDRVMDHFIEHPAIILRETHYWRCPICNTVAGRETLDLIELIEYISSNA